jgi:outer membrane lipoprotein SlyB
MTRTPLLIALAAAAALAGCNNGNTIGGADNSTNSAENAPVVLPPTIAQSKIYRCADNKVVYVDWLSDNKSANVRTEAGGMATQVTAAEVGKPMTSPTGFSIEGSPAASSIKAAVPGHPAQSCKA